MAKIRITSGDVDMTAELNASDTARALLDVLPVTCAAQRWGDEVYFSIPLEHGEENPQATAPSGAIAYWPPGNAFCIFFGQAPYSPVNLLGTLDGDAAQFRAVSSGQELSIEKV